MKPLHLSQRHFEFLADTLLQASIRTELTPTQYAALLNFVTENLSETNDNFNARKFIERASP